MVDFHIRSTMTNSKPVPRRSLSGDTSQTFFFNEEPNPIAHAHLGGAERDRTDDLLLAKQALSQLSYSPNLGWDSLAQWWAREDLNFRPHAYQARALTN